MADTVLKTKLKPKPRKLTKQLLTAKQEAFAFEYMTNGHDATKAYMEVYNVKEDVKMSGVYVDAHKVLKNPKVSLRVHELQMAGYSKEILTIDEIKQMLTNRAKDGLNADGLKAIDLLNKMGGNYAPEKHEHSGEIRRGMDSFYDTVAVIPKA